MNGAIIAPENTAPAWTYHCGQQHRRSWSRSCSSRVAAAIAAVILAIRSAVVAVAVAAVGTHAQVGRISGRLVELPWRLGIFHGRGPHVLGLGRGAAEQAQCTERVETEIASLPTKNGSLPHLHVLWPIVERTPRGAPKAGPPPPVNLRPVGRGCLTVRWPENRARGKTGASGKKVCGSGKDASRGAALQLSLSGTGFPAEVYNRELADIGHGFAGA